MAPIHKILIETHIQCSHFKFFEFFMKQANLLPAVSPRNVKKIELVDGTTSWETKEGSRKLVHFDEGGQQQSYKDEAVKVDHEAKKVTYKLLDGTMTLLYDSFKATLEVTPGTAKWTVEFVKKSPSCPDPDHYLVLLDSVNKDVDHHLQQNN